MTPKGSETTGGPPGRPGEHWKATVLAVEDDADQLRLYAKILRRHRLLTVASGTQALEAIAAEIPDVIILDHVLAEGERGTDVLPLLREQLAHVPVIIVSGTLDIRGQLAALQGPYAAHYVIEKPVDIDVLRETVDQAIAECGMAETVRSIRSLERAEKIRHSEPERLFSERLARQHEMVNRLRQDGATANVSQLSRLFKVSRRTIARDLTDLIARGQLDPAAYPEWKGGDGEAARE